jgi:hypothetical protein
VVVCVFAMLTGFDRDRVFYPTLATVIATYYILFAVIGSSTPALALESLIAGAFLALAVTGFKKNLWLIVAALAGQVSPISILPTPRRASSTHCRTICSNSNSNCAATVS